MCYFLHIIQLRWHCLSLRMSGYVRSQHFSFQPLKKFFKFLIEKTFRQTYNSAVYCISDCSDPCEFVAVNGRDCVTSCSNKNLSLLIFTFNSKHVFQAIYSSDYKRCLPSCSGELKNNFPFPDATYGSICIEKCDSDASKNYKVGTTLGANCICNNLFPINADTYGDACLNTCGKTKKFLKNFFDCISFYF